MPEHQYASRHHQWEEKPLAAEGRSQHFNLMRKQLADERPLALTQGLASVRNEVPHAVHRPHAVEPPGVLSLLHGFKLSDALEETRTPDSPVAGEAPGADRGRPQWAVILIASVATCALLVVLTRIAARLGSPVPVFGATDVQKLRDEYQRSLESTRVLEEALRASEAEATQAERDQMLRDPPDPHLDNLQLPGRTAEVAAAAVTATKFGRNAPPPTCDELRGEMLYRTHQLDEMAGRAGKAAISHVGPAIAKANKAAGFFNKKVHTIRDRMHKMAKDEVVGLLASVTTTLDQEFDDTQVNDNLPEGFRSGDDFGDLESPPVALFLSGVFAPMQLHALVAWSRLEMYWSCVMLSMGVLTKAMDLHHSCNSSHVVIWLHVLLCIQTLSFLSSAVIQSKATYAITELQEDLEALQRADHTVSGSLTGNAVWDAFFKIQGNSGYYIKALLRYDGIVTSSFFMFGRCVNCMKFKLGIYSWFATYVEIFSGQDHQCDKKEVVWFLRTYSIFFSITFLWTLADLVLWIAFRVLTSNWLNIKVLETAKRLDDDFALKVPVFLTLAKAYIFRNSAALYKVRGNVLREDIRRLEAETQSVSAQARHLETKLAARREEEEHLRGMQLTKEEEEDELIAKYKERLHASMNTVAPLVALAAANIDADAPHASAVGRAEGGLVAGEFSQRIPHDQAAGDPPSPAKWGSVSSFGGALPSEPEVIAANLLPNDLPNVAPLAEVTKFGGVRPRLVHAAGPASGQVGDPTDVPALAASESVEGDAVRLATQCSSNKSGMLAPDGGNSPMSSDLREDSVEQHASDFAADLSPPQPVVKAAGVDTDLSEGCGWVPHPAASSRAEQGDTDIPSAPSQVEGRGSPANTDLHQPTDASLLQDQALSDNVMTHTSRVTKAPSRQDGDMPENLAEGLSNELGLMQDPVAKAEEASAEEAGGADVVKPKPQESNVTRGLRLPRLQKAVMQQDSATRGPSSGLDADRPQFPVSGAAAGGAEDLIRSSVGSGFIQDPDTVE